MQSLSLMVSVAVSKQKRPTQLPVFVTDVDDIVLLHSAHLQSWKRSSRFLIEV